MPQVAQNTHELSLALPARPLVRCREAVKQPVPFGMPTTPPRKAPKQIPAHQGKAGKKKVWKNSPVTIKRVAAILELPTEEVDRLLDEGRIPFSDVRGQRMVEFDDVLEFKYARAEEKDAEACQAMKDGALTIEQAARYLQMSIERIAGWMDGGGTRRLRVSAAACRNRRQPVRGAQGIGDRRRGLTIVDAVTGAAPNCLAMWLIGSRAHWYAKPGDNDNVRIGVPDPSMHGYSSASSTTRLAEGRRSAGEAFLCAWRNRFRGNDRHR